MAYAPQTWGDEVLLAVSLDPLPLQPEVKDKLMARVAADAQYRPAVCVRRTQGEWVPSGAPGVAIKPLYRDRSTGLSTVLVRMEPGAAYPAHRHIDAEQCLVVEGDLRWEDVEYSAGDFVVASDGSIHPRLTTTHGNILLIVSGGNEFLPA